MRDSRMEHIAAIDLVRGCAILWVLMIHAVVLPGTFLMRHVVNHAVPIFIVLFGLTGELWWRRRRAHPVRAWYTTRARRLVVPMWATVLVWWGIAAVLRPPLGFALTPVHFAEQALGWLRGIGTGWFITLLLQLVVLFPLFHAAARRWGAVALVFSMAAVTVLASLANIDVFFRLGLFPMLVFSPRFFLHVAFGIFLADRLAGLRALALCLALAAACIVAQDRIVHDPGWRLVAERLLDLPLTVIMLVALAPLARVPLAAPLAWLGRNSYGVYLGQLLVHNAVMLSLRPAAAPGQALAWLYVLVLLAGGIAFVKASDLIAGIAAGIGAAEGGSGGGVGATPERRL